jgi:hypothetical protein
VRPHKLRWHRLRIRRGQKCRLRWLPHHPILIPISRLYSRCRASNLQSIKRPQRTHLTRKFVGWLTFGKDQHQRTLTWRSLTRISLYSKTMVGMSALFHQHPSLLVHQRLLQLRLGNYTRINTATIGISEIHQSYLNAKLTQLLKSTIM